MKNLHRLPSSSLPRHAPRARWWRSTVVVAAIAALTTAPGAGAWAQTSRASVGDMETLGSLTGESGDRAAPVEFDFGLYGRINVATDGSSSPEPFNVVAHGPRWQKSPYQELTVVAAQPRNNRFAVPMPWAVTFTVAFRETLFHTTGQWRIDATVRDLYAHAEPIDNLDVWIGSRMYRGHYVYLFDWHPVRDLNTVGGGCGYRFNAHVRVTAHVGWNVLEDDPRIVGDRLLPHPRYPGTISQRYLERQRFIASLQGDVGIGSRVHLALNGELHRFPEGEWIDPTTSAPETIPSETGLKFGAGISVDELRLVEPLTSSVHGFASMATGRAAYGTLGIPADHAIDETVGDAFEAVIGASAALELGRLGLHTAAYGRRFEDADNQTELDLDDRWEVAVAARPEIYLGQVLRVGGEVSFQRAVPDGIFASSNRNEALDVVELTGFGLIAVSNDEGLFSRPQLRLFVTAVFLNDPAREWLDDYVSYDRPNEVELFFGLSAEWWFGTTGG